MVDLSSLTIWLIRTQTKFYKNSETQVQWHHQDFIGTLIVENDWLTLEKNCEQGWPWLDKALCEKWSFRTSMNKS